MTRTLITGAGGFIGSHVLEHWLAETDDEFVVLEGLTYAGDVQRFTSSRYFDPKRVTVLYHDLRSPLPTTLLSRIGQVDYILSIASDSDVDRSILDPAPFIIGNVQVAVHVLEFARTQKRLKALYSLSTDEVFGPAQDGYHHHEWDVILPSNPYSASKAGQDAAGTGYWRTYGIPYVRVHLMNAIGERQGASKMVTKTIARLHAGLPMTVHGQQLAPGSWQAGSRKYLHARNLADGILFLRRNTEPEQYPESDRPSVWNIAGEEVTNDEMVRRIANIMGVVPQIDWVDFHDARTGHDRRYSLDDSKIRRAGWEPPLSLDQSLEKVVKWMLDHPQWLAAV